MEFEVSGNRLPLPNSKIAPQRAGDTPLLDDLRANPEFQKLTKN